MDTKKVEITREQISNMLHAWPEGLTDPRVQVMLDLAGEYEQYTKKLEWLSRNLVDEVEKNRAHGLTSVYETVLSTSLIPDISRHAAKLAALVRVLDCACKAKDDPKATVVDQLIHTLKR